MGHKRIRFPPRTKRSRGIAALGHDLLELAAFVYAAARGVSLGRARAVELARKRVPGENETTSALPPPPTTFS